MTIYICPICDKKMKTKHFCINCRSYIKEPVIREMTYYLNERHPEKEADCTYHQMEETRGFKTEPKTEPAARRTAVPNQPSLSGRANLNGEHDIHVSVPNQPTSYDRTGAPVHRQPATPNRPRMNMPGQPVNMENMEQYVKAMKDLGQTGLRGVSELLKEYNRASQSNESGQEEKKQEQKKISPVAMVIIFIVFANVFTSVIVPFLRYIMFNIF